MHKASGNKSGQQRAAVPLPPAFEDWVAHRLGPDRESFYRVLHEDAPTSVFRNPRKSWQGVDGMKGVPWSAEGFYLPERPSFTMDPHFQAGAYYVQEASSMFLSDILRTRIWRDVPLKALDLCGAPGGKSVILVSGLPQGSLVVSNEVIPLRFETLNQNLDKWGYPNVVRTCKDPSRMPWDEIFDLILVDAPCSGEGMFRKDPDARTHWSPGHVALCSARQKRILHDAVRMLRPGGMLVYSTCTFNDEENIHQVAWLNQTYGLTSVKLNMDETWGIEMREFQNQYGYQFWPQMVQGEGFFCSLMQKPDDEKHLAHHRRKSKMTANRMALPAEYLHWIDQDKCAGALSVHPAGKDALSFLFTSLDTEFLSGEKGLRIGTEFGKGMGHAFAPAHALALSICLSAEVSEIELTRDEAVRFLKKAIPELGPTEKGWHLATFEGSHLGWIKQTGAGPKNYLPMQWRILQDQ